MKAVIALLALVAAARGGVLPATTFVRAPSFDSAVIKSDRLGGNFAYSTAEGHAYAAVSPVVQRVSHPVAVSYTAHQVPLGHAAVPVAVSQPLYTQTSFVHQPVFAHPGAILGHPVVGHPVVGHPAPIVGHPAPVGGGVASAPPAPANIAPTPVQGTVVDADTVAVESA